MECERLQLSWGMGFLDTEYPKIETGETVLIRGRRSSNEILINHLICEELSKRQPVYWIDGGMRLDPSLLIPTLLKKNGKITNLDYLYASRGFTAHQMLEIIKRLAREKENKKGDGFLHRLLKDIKFSGRLRQCFFGCLNNNGGDFIRITIRCRATVFKTTFPAILNGANRNTDRCSTVRNSITEFVN